MLSCCVLRAACCVPKMGQQGERRDGGGSLGCLVYLRVHRVGESPVVAVSMNLTTDCRLVLVSLLMGIECAPEGIVSDMHPQQQRLIDVSRKKKRGAEIDRQVEPHTHTYTHTGQTHYRDTNPHPRRRTFYFSRPTATPPTLTQPSLACHDARFNALTLSCITWCAS